LVEFRFPRRAIIAVAAAALAAFIGAGAIASQQASAAADPSPQWVSCAEEHGVCVYPDNGPEPRNRQVRYGDYTTSGETWMLGKWTHRVARGQSACDNSVFVDVYPARLKHCEVDMSPWVYCANEGEVCKAPNGSQVRYGAPSPIGMPDDQNAPIELQGYRVKTFYDTESPEVSLSCSNDTFGGDPQPNVVKQCWIYEDGPSWKYVYRQYLYR
jgi:hypothetical protein